MSLIKFTLRTESTLMKKLHYVSEYNGRSSNKEIEQLIIKHIAEFEAEHDDIDIKE